jgi:hypothetical protein
MKPPFFPYTIKIESGTWGFYHPTKINFIMMKRIYYILIPVLFLFSCEKPISEFQSANFIKFFGSGYESKGNDVIELSDGGYVVTGYDMVNGTDKQIFLAKVDLNGNIVWSNTFGNFKASNSVDEGRILKEVSDGLLVAGTCVRSSGITQSFIMKVSIYGDLDWYKELDYEDDSTYNLEVKDIFVSDNNIFVAGQGHFTNYWAEKLSLDGDKVWSNSWDGLLNSSFSRVFQDADTVLLVGTDGNGNYRKITSININGNKSPINDIPPLVPDESTADASLVGEILYILSNSSSGTQLLKLNASHIIEWQTEKIASVTGKSFAYKDDGTIMICGESTEGGVSSINFIKVDASGSTDYGPQSFRNLQGSIERVIQTKDKGLILVGTTNGTFGSRVQLIKTDKDYFMLKN